MTSSPIATLNGYARTGASTAMRIVVLMAMGLSIIVVTSGCIFKKPDPLKTTQRAILENAEKANDPNASPREKTHARLRLKVANLKFVLFTKDLTASQKVATDKALKDAETALALFESSGARAQIRSNVVKSQKTATTAATLQAPGSTLNRCADPDDADCD